MFVQKCGYAIVALTDRRPLTLRPHLSTSLPNISLSYTYDTIQTTDMSIKNIYFKKISLSPASHQH